MAKFLTTRHSFSNGELGPEVLGRTDINEYLRGCKKLEGYVVGDTGAARAILGSTWRANSFAKIHFTIRERFAFGLDNGVPKLYEAKLSFPSLSILMEEVPLLIEAGLDLSQYQYGTHINLNQITIFTDLYGKVPPVVLFNDEAGWTLLSYTAYGIRFGLSGVSNNIKYYESFAMRPENKDGNSTISVIGTTMSSAKPIFKPDMVGSVMYVGISGTEDAVIQIETYVDANNITFSNLVSSLTDVTYKIYRLPSWYSGNWPKVVSFFQNRLAFANTDTEIDTIWNTEANNIVNVAPPLRGVAISANQPFYLQPATTDVSPIMWLIPERYMSVGTGTEEYIVNLVDGIYSNANASITSVSKYGSARVGLAFRAQSSTYFVERNGSNVREMSYSNENGGYVSRNLSILGPYIGTISRILYDYSNKRIYAKGDLATYCCTVDNSAGIVAWSNVGLNLSDNIAGIVDINGNPEILYSGVSNISSIAIYTESRDFSASSSTVGWTKSPVIEVSGLDFRLHDLYANDGDTVLYAVDGVATGTTINIALGHSVFPDGAVYVTLSVDPIVIFKRKLVSILETSPIQEGSPIGDSQIGYNRVDKIGLRLYKAGKGIQIGTTLTSLETVNIEGSFTGVKELSPDGSPEVDHSVIVYNESTNPCVIVSISARGLESEG